MVISAPWFLVPSGFSAIALFPFILIRKGVKATPRLLNHERIHLRQQIELLVIPFYLLYLLEYIIRFIQYRNPGLAYRNISFEREAYENDADKNYLASRKFWASFRYL
jgi:hypothetical protein